MFIIKCKCSCTAVNVLIRTYLMFRFNYWNIWRLATVIIKFMMHSFFHGACFLYAFLFAINIITLMLCLFLKFILCQWYILPTIFLEKKNALTFTGWCVTLLSDFLLILIMPKKTSEVYSKTQDECPILYALIQSAKWKT